MEQRAGIVFVGEDFDPEDVWMCSGRFRAHWEAEDGREFVEGPEGVSLDEAIAWGRDRADVVLVRLIDSDETYSAGTRQPTGDGDATPVWPESATVQRRRRRGMEHLDICADQPLEWVVRLPRPLPAKGFHEYATRITDALTAQDGVAEVRAEESGRPFVAVFRFSVFARSHAEALEQVLGVERQTLDLAPFAIDGVVVQEEGVHYDPLGWSPDHDIRPADRY